MNTVYFRKQNRMCAQTHTRAEQKENLEIIISLWTQENISTNFSRHRLAPSTHLLCSRIQFLSVIVMNIPCKQLPAMRWAFSLTSPPIPFLFYCNVTMLQVMFITPPVTKWYSWYLYFALILATGGNEFPATLMHR